MLSKAEKALDEALDFDVRDETIKPAVAGLRQDAAKFVASRLGKDDGYSERRELTAKNGEALPATIQFITNANADDTANS